MKSLTNFFLTCFVTIFTVHSSPASVTHDVNDDPGCHLFPAVRKVAENFYTSRIPNKNLSLVMERIDGRTHPLWLRYAEIQNNSRVAQYIHRQYKLDISDGTALFKAVLNEVSYTENEIWVAYITKAATPQKISNDMYAYNTDDIQYKKDSFAKDIEMFVTVTSSHDALITSHMGIAASAEGIIGGRTRGTSVDLHSFAAKVMLMRNPDRKYMVNAPVFAMENIISKAIPSALFVGTREQQQILQDAQSIDFKSYKETHTTQVLERLRTKAQREASRKNRALYQVLEDIEEDAGVSRKTQEKQIYEEFVNDLPFSSLMELVDGHFIVSEKKLQAEFPAEIRKAFISARNPYFFEPAKSRASSSRKFLKFMKKHPPILSISQHQSAGKTFTLYDHSDMERPWLSFGPENQSYKWVFTRPFLPAGITHYCVVDLQNLANSKAIE